MSGQPDQADSTSPKISPKISIGIVVYNGAAHIRHALESVVQQPYKNIELIVVDGGSKDGTLKVLDEYTQHISVLVSEPDKGIYDAMNKVCLLATGDWLIFLGCDDALLDALDNISKALTNPDVIYYGNVILHSNSKIYGGRFSKYRLMQQNFCHQSVFYPRLVYKNYSYCLKYKALADYSYNLKLFGDKFRFVYLNELVTIYNDQGFSSHGDDDFERDRTKLIGTAFGLHYALFYFFHKQIIIKIDSTILLSGIVMKRILPTFIWKPCQIFWRKIRQKM